MTRIDIYTSALDRQVITNRKWQNGEYRYIQIGSVVYVDKDYPSRINMLNESDNDEWVLGGRVTRWFKFKFKLKLMLLLWNQLK